MIATLHGPWPNEPPQASLGPVATLAVVADVHSNIPALEAVLAEPDVRQADLVVFCGDLTWGPEPRQAIELVGTLEDRAVFVRGNGDRAVVELARGGRRPERPRDEWMRRRHTEASIDFLAGFLFNVVVTVLGLGPIRFCHGSPRSDTELVTPETPPDRYAALAEGVCEPTIVHGHTHLQFDRMVAGRRSLNPGSVGLPYHEREPGTAYWAILGPDVSLRQSRYSVTESIERTRKAGDPAADTIAALLMTPPTPREVIADAERLVFSD